MADRLKGRIAVVTGGSSGIGRAIAIRFAEVGARIVIADLKSAGVEKEITDKHGKDSAIFVKCDVSKESDIENMVKEAAKWGGRVDISLNFAGVAVETKQGMKVRAHECPVEDFDFTHSINERGVWLSCKHALRQMMEQEPREANARGERTRGWIVNAASILGLVAYPFVSCYTPAKHAVVGMTKQMALDYAKDRIHINAICPGFVQSPMIASLTQAPEAQEGLNAQHPWGAIGRPEDIADAALFLSSDEAGWVTGTAMTVDGAYTCQ